LYAARYTQYLLRIRQVNRIVRHNNRYHNRHIVRLLPTMPEAGHQPAGLQLLNYPPAFPCSERRASHGSRDWLTAADFYADKEETSFLDEYQSDELN